MQASTSFLSFVVTMSPFLISFIYSFSWFWSISKCTVGFLSLFLLHLMSLCFFIMRPGFLLRLNCAIHYLSPFHFIQCPLYVYSENNSQPPFSIQCTLYYSHLSPTKVSNPNLLWLHLNVFSRFLLLWFFESPPLTKDLCLKLTVWFYSCVLIRKVHFVEENQAVNRTQTFFQYR